LKNKIKDNYSDELKKIYFLSLITLASWDPENGIEYMNEAYSKDSNNCDILNNLGYFYHKQKFDYHKAEEYYKKCIENNPKYFMAYRGITDIYYCLNEYQKELDYINLGIQNTDDPSLINRLGVFLSHKNMESKEYIINLFRDILKKDPKPSSDILASSYVNWGHVESVYGNPEKAIQLYTLGLVHLPNDFTAYNNILLNIHYFRSVGNSKILKNLCKQFHINHKIPFEEIINELHKKICFKLYKPTLKFNDINYSLTNRKLHVGFLSGDLYNHPVAYFTKAILDNYSKDKFKFFLYSNSHYSEDIVKDYFHNIEYHCIVSHSLDIIVMMIKSHQIDLLIDLSGHTAKNRLDVLAKHPSPKVCTFLGYPNNLGMYNRISDEFTERCNPNFNSKWKMKRCFLCYTPTNHQEPKTYKNFDPK
jgi:predicted O-linked N-acetylglucosamine transferase (SPINDLY family)